MGTSGFVASEGNIERKGNVKKSRARRVGENLIINLIAIVGHGAEQVKSCKLIT